MSAFGRIRRRPDHWASPHERARARAAERMDGPLGLSEATWLDEHLAGCAECAAVAASYEDGRAALQGLRTATPEPPRDLWARTSAAIERESIARGRTPKPASASGRRVPVGALSGLAVIAVVVGVSAVSSGLLDGGIPTQDGASPEVTASDQPTSPGPVAATPGATPFPVGAGDVQWLSASDGKTAFNTSRIHEVCPVSETPDCAPLAGDGSDLTIDDRPTTVFGSPTREEAVVVTDDGDGQQQLIVVVLPTPEPVPTDPTASPEPTESPEPTTSPEATASGPLTESPAPTASAEPTESVEPSDPLSTATPPIESAAPTIDPSVIPSLEPEGQSIGIPAGVEVDAGSAAFSSDGMWFAFTATDGSSGPNVYVWRSGDVEARAITNDGRSVFASWAGDQVVISRTPDPATSVGSSASLEPSEVPTASPNVTAEPMLVLPESALIDPATEVESPVDGAIWRPVVDPLVLRAVAWVGTVTSPAAPDRLEMEDGQLELIVWPGDAPDAGIPELPQVVAEGPLADFDVRWDETGEWFALWTPDPEDPNVGRLSLFRVDLQTGALVVPEDGPTGVPALEGFSIGQGRLAWATPPGTDGEGSRILIAAWTKDGVGTLESDPGEDLIVVR